MTQPTERQSEVKPGLLETRVVPRAGAHKVPGLGPRRPALPAEPSTWLAPPPMTL